MMTIKQKQWQLKYLGFYAGDIDGAWGDASRSATIEFQRAVGIKDDGIFGTNSEQKSMEMVDAIQDALIVNTKITLVNDGLAGPSTMNATKVYQAMKGLPETGFATKDVRDMIIEDYPEKIVTPETTGNWWDSIEFFDREEFKCKCGGKHCNGYPTEMKKDVVVIADLARKHFGAPGHVVSGLRCKIHNSKEGGVVNSQHMYGEAIDLRIDGVTADQLLAFVNKQRGVRYAYKINSTNVHFDIPKGVR